MDGRPGLARSRDCAAQCSTSSRFLRSFREHSGYYVSEMIAEICRCGAAAAGASLVRQAPSGSILKMRVRVAGLVLACAGLPAAGAHLSPIEPGLDYHSFANVDQFRTR